MTALAILDIEESKELDQNAMSAVLGGWTYTGRSNSYSSWSTVSDQTWNGGYQNIGTIRYRIVNRRIRKQRTHTRSKNYKRLEFSGYL